MPDIVTSVKLKDGSRYAVFHFTNLSDGTGETDVVKVNVATLVPAASKVKIKKIQYSIEGMAVRVRWQAASNVDAVILTRSGVLDWSDIGGLVNTAGSGVTGNILFSTVGHTSGDSYSITLYLEKE